MEKVSWHRDAARDRDDENDAAAWHVGRGRRAALQGHDCRAREKTGEIQHESL